MTKLKSDPDETWIDPGTVKMIGKTHNMEKVALRMRIAELEEALRRFRSFAASVWFDEGNCTDEECEAMERARRAIIGKQ